MTASVVIVYANSGYEHYLLKYVTGSVNEETTHETSAKVVGRFAGNGAAVFNLNGEPIFENDIRVRRLYRGESPVSGESLRKRQVPVRIYTNQKTGEKEEHKTVTAVEICFSCPENVSDLFGTANREMRERILPCTQKAAHAALHEIERSYCFTRTGAGGKNREQAKPIFACFTHYTSRMLDPQLHVHVQLFSTVIRQDGKGGALDTRALLKREVIFKLGQIFRDALRYHLSEEFSYFQFPVVPIKNGLSFGIAGIPEALSKAFSNRRSRIEEGLKDLEKPSSRQVQKVVLETRPAKPKNISSEALFERWQAVGRIHGFHADAFEAKSREQYLLAQTFKASMLHLQTPVPQTFKSFRSNSDVLHETPTRKSPGKNHFSLLTAPQQLQSPEKRRSLIQTLKDIMTPEWLRPVGDVDAELRRARIRAAKRQERFQKKITRLYWQGRVPLATYLRCVKGIGEPRRKWAIELKFFLGQMNLAQRLYLWSKHRHGIPTIGVPRSRAFINLYAAAGKISRTQQILLLERNGHIRGHKHSHRY